MKTIINVNEGEEKKNAYMLLMEIKTSATFVKMISIDVPKTLNIELQ